MWYSLLSAKILLGMRSLTCVGKLLSSPAHVGET